MPTTPIALRPATAHDVESIAAIHAASWRATYRGLLPDTYLDADAARERKQYWQQKMAEPGSEHLLVLIAEQDGTAIGFVCGKWEADSRWGALLDNLHVLPPWQRTGAGKLMSDAVQDWARAHGAGQLYLYVLEGNRPAIAWYERQGWQFAGTEPDRLSDFDVTVRRYIYRL